MARIIRFAVLVAIYCTMTSAQQKSDYAIAQRFQMMVQNVSKAIDSAQTVQECVEANAAIMAIENEFHEDSALLDRAVYPDGYEKTIVLLKSKLMVRQKDLGIIESQITRIGELETQIRTLSDQLSKLNLQNDKLLSDVKQLSDNVKRLTGDIFSSTTPIDSLRSTIVKLRQGIQDRDALIFALTDSLFMQYDKNVSDMKDVERQGVMAKLEKHGIVGNVKKAIVDNLAFLDAIQLKGNDLVTLVRQQQRFQSQWVGLAPKLASLYLVGKSKKTDIITVDSMLAVWGDKVESGMWRSLNAMFKDKGFAIHEFKTGDEFVSDFNSFLDDQIQNTAKDEDNTRFKLYTNFFENFWQTDLEPIWLPSLVELHKITDSQKKDLEVKMEQWKSSVRPGFAWKIYLAILLLCILGGAIVWYIMKTRQHASTSDQ